MLTLETVREAIAHATDHHGVLVLHPQRLTHDLYILWFGGRGTYHQAVSSIEDNTTAHAFGALELAEALAARLDVALYAFVPRPEPPQQPSTEQPPPFD